MSFAKAYYDREVDYVVDPLSKTDFFQTYWDQKPLYVPGPPGKFSAIYSLESWERCQHFGAVSAHMRDERGDQKEIRIDPSQSHLLYLAGMTVCADVTGDPMLAPFLRGFCGGLKMTGGTPFAKLYASKDQRGFGVHTDPFHVFVLQVKGSKRWRYSKQPAYASPLCGARLDRAGNPVLRSPREGERMTLDDGTPVDPPNVEEFDTAVLTEGDCLYLPPGVWHVTEAVGDSIGISVSPPRTPVFHLLMQALQDVLLQKAEWRRDVFAGASEPMEPGRTSPSVEETFSARLSDLKLALEQIDPRILHRIWRMNVETAGGHIEAEASGHGADISLEASDVLEQVGPEPFQFLIAPSINGNDEILFYRNSTEWSLPIEALRFASELTRNPKFRADAASSWDKALPWDDVRSLLAQRCSPACCGV